MSMLTRTVWILATVGSLGVLPAQEKEAPPSTETLIEQLGDRNYQVRKSAEEALRQRGKDAAEALRKAAGSAADTEVQWRAQRLLRQIESGEDGRLRKNAPGAPTAPPAPGSRSGAPGSPDLEGMFDDMFERLERDFGMTVPRGRFFHDDFFKDLQQQMRGGSSFNMISPGQSFSMQMGPDGVRVEIVERGEDGKSETKVYEAKDEQEFRSKFPEIAQRYLGGGQRGFAFPGMPRLRVFDGRGFAGEPRPMPDLGQVQVMPAEIDRSEIDSGARLGAMVEAVPESIRDFLGLAEGEGLRVQSCTDGSLAAALGLREGDIVLEVAGRKVGGPEDVRDALASVAAGAKVEVLINRRGAAKTLSANKPEKKPARKLEPVKPEGEGKGEKKTEIR